MDGGYPKRKPFFAHRFVRLLAKVCAAQEIGIEAFALLTVIAHTEDARGYRSPVTFFNEQLVPMVGFGSVDSMARARKRAVDGGWLHYEPGMRRKAGVYWVTIPDEFQTFDDAPSDEGYHRTRADIQTPILPQGCGTNREESAELTERKVRSQTRTNREESAEPSSLSLSLPLSLPQEKTGATFDPETWFTRFWEMYPRKGNKPGTRLEWDRLVVDQTDAEAVIAGVEKWKVSPEWSDPNYIPRSNSFLSARKWEDEPITETPKAKPNASDQRKNERTKYRYDAERDG